MKTMLPVLMLAILGLAGCAAASGNVCSGVLSVTTISPATATLDHAAAAPANQVQFVATTKTTYPAGCAVPTYLVAPYQTKWMSSDIIDAPIDSTPGEKTNGIAVCQGPTIVPVTISTGSGTDVASATLVCK